jgi:RsiW-degrading membrane proteinase PrsW (M82 family)
MAIPFLEILFGLFPVLLFLGALFFLDSFKLVRAGAIALTLAVGAGSAVAAGLISTALLQRTGIPLATYTRFVAPPLEELLKAGFLLYLFRTHRIGFLVDGAIHGFALGAGFAVVENLWYLFDRGGGAVFLWLIRGVGTAIMHGGTTAIVAILFKSLADRFGSTSPLLLFPGYVIAVAVHSVYNHFFLAPTASAAIMLGIMPVLVVFVFANSERRTRRWLGGGFDADQELLEMLMTGVLSETRIGRYLHTLQERFPGPVVADMLCYLRVYLELSIKVKGLLLMRDAGFEVTPDAEAKAQLEELRYLERSVGKTGMLSLAPFMQRGSRDLWQLTMLEN